MKQIERLHFITCDLEHYAYVHLAEMACRGGAKWIQLRIKNKPEDECLVIATQVKAICKNFSAKLVINDYVDIAKSVDADGVHLGKEDMNPVEARKILGDQCIIGGTANTVEDVLQQINNGCDYIGLGPYRFTHTKEKLSPVLGLAGIQKIASRFSAQIPIIAIGSISLNDIPSLMATGIHGIAVSSAITHSSSVAQKTAEFINVISKKI